MDTVGSFTADLILASPKAYAAGAVERHAKAKPGLVEAYGRYGFADLTSDTQVRLEYLCEALATGKVELFYDHVGWLKSTFAAKDAPEDFLSESLRYLAEELRESLPHEAGSMASAYVEKGMDYLEQVSSAMPSLLEGDAPHLDLTRKYLLAVLENRADDAVQLVIDASESGLSMQEIYAAVLVRPQEEIGRMWQVGEVTVAEEHYGSRIAERVIVELSRRMPKADRHGSKVICAAVGGNLHDVGIRVVSAHFETAGWHSILLGANMPIRDLIQAIVDFEAGLLALSASLVLHLRATGELIRNVRGVQQTQNVPILVGGMPFQLVPDLWEIVGADGVAQNAEEAVEVGTRLVNSS